MQNVQHSLHLVASIGITNVDILYYIYYECVGHFIDFIVQCEAVWRVGWGWNLS